jgi:AcrR family transcriptional regulator
MDFKRARHEEQRDQRRRAILDTAAAMLIEAPVAELGLNELSRRVGIAKSSVLRYFESREAVLLDLLNGELSDWIANLDFASLSPDASIPARATAVGHELASSLARRPVLCDLISAQAAVLERNVSTEAVLQHKRAVGGLVDDLTARLRQSLPELDADDAYHVILTTILMVSAIWPHSRPSEALAAAYAVAPEIGAHQLEFQKTLEKMVVVTISGLVALKQVVSAL